MTPQQVKQRFDYIDARLDHWAEILVRLQGECTHPNVKKKYRGSSGNYDPSADSYWIEFDCPDCGKRWQEDQ